MYPLFGLSDDGALCVISKNRKYGKRTQSDSHQRNQQNQGPLRGNVSTEVISSCRKKQMMYAECQCLFSFNKKHLMEKLRKRGYR